jgi:hypothetical protein
MPPIAKELLRFGTRTDTYFININQNERDCKFPAFYVIRLPCSLLHFQEIQGPVRPVQGSEY